MTAAKYAADCHCVWLRLSVDGLSNVAESLRGQASITMQLMPSELVSGLDVQCSSSHNHGVTHASLLCRRGGSCVAASCAVAANCCDAQWVGYQLVPLLGLLLNFSRLLNKAAVKIMISKLYQTAAKVDLIVSSSVAGMTHVNAYPCPEGWSSCGSQQTLFDGPSTSCPCVLRPVHLWIVIILVSVSARTTRDGGGMLSGMTRSYTTTEAGAGGGMTGIVAMRTATFALDTTTGAQCSKGALATRHNRQATRP
jgi:hypothetical protein